VTTRLIHEPSIVFPWHEIVLTATPWFGFGGQVAFSLFDNAHLALDFIQTLAAPTRVGAPFPKPTIFGTDLADASSIVAWFARFSLPEPAVGTQRGRLVEWSGDVDRPMGDSAGLRRAIQIESNIVYNPQLDPPRDVDSIFYYLQFRGHGEPRPSDGFQTQDTPISTTEFSGSTTFPNMSLPPFGQTTPTTSFAAGTGHVLRTQALVEVPCTVSGFGEWFELGVGVRPGAAYADFFGQNTPLLQHFSARWRIISPPYPFEPNSVTQLTRTSGPPGAEDESAPRLEEVLYRP